MKTKLKNSNKIISIVLALVMLIGMLPINTVLATDAVELPTKLYVGDTLVVQNGTVQSVTSGNGWSFDSTTATLTLNDGFNMEYSKASGENCVIYCEGDLNIVSNGSVTIPGAYYGIFMPSGHLKLDVQSGTLLVKDADSSGTAIYQRSGSRLSVNVSQDAVLNVKAHATAINSSALSFAGKGTINVTASNPSSKAIYARDVLKIDGVTMNLTGGNEGSDILAGADITIGETEASTVNLLGRNKEGIEGSNSSTVSITNGSLLRISAKSGSTYVCGVYAGTVNISNSTVIMEALNGKSHNNYGFVGNLNVSGNSHIRGACSSTDTKRGFASGTISVTGNYHYRKDSTESFSYNNSITKKTINYFELITEEHLDYTHTETGHTYGCASATCPCSVVILAEEAHSYDNNCDTTCNVCGAERTIYHDWSNLDGICKVCSAECAHEDTYNNLIRPVQNADGTWGKGKIVKICNICGNSSLVQEVERDHEGYKVFDETAAELEAILNSGKMTDTWKNDYTNSLNGLRNSAYYQVYTEIETAIPSMTESLKSIIAAIEAGIADGTMIKADFTYMTSLFDEINALIDNDPNKLIPSESGRFQGIYYGYYMSCKNNGNHSQADYDQNMAGNNWEGQIEEILAGVKDGTMLKADYTEIDEAIAALDEKLADVNLTDEAKAGLEEIKSQLEEMKKNPLSSKADLAELEEALEDYETEVDAGIEDGSAVEVDGLKEIEDFAEPVEQEIKEKYGEKEYHAILNSMSDEADAERYSIIREARSLTGSLKDNADKLEELKARLQAIFDEVINCLDGVHNGLVYEVTEEASCEANAVESATCTLCGEVLTKEVENSALKHSFTKYEETEAPKCGVAGKEVAYCDNGCGEIEVRATEALKHIPLDAVKENEVDPECEKEGSYDLVVYCDLCGGEISRETFAVDALEHLFLDYIYNEDATCTADGTKTAECVNGCGETDTVTAEDTMIDHVDEDGDNICDDCEAEIVDICPDCGGPAHEETGVPQYICMLITLIKLVVSLVQVLQSLQTVA